MSVRYGNIIVAGMPGKALPKATLNDYTRVVRVSETGEYELGSEQYTPNLFDYKYSDYQLNDASWLNGDTFSWQSGGVYKVAYQHLLNDYNNATEKSVYYSSNITPVGMINNDKGTLSGFYTNIAYATINVKRPQSNFYLVIKTSGCSASAWTSQSILTFPAAYEGIVFRFDGTVLKLWISSNGTSYDVASGYNTGLTVPVGVDVWFKLVWSGTQYIASYSTDGITWVAGTPLTSDKAPYWDDKVACIGGTGFESYPFAGKIYLQDSYLNIDSERFWKGCNYWKYKEALDGHRFVNYADHDKLAELYTNTGLGWYYIVDTANSRFKLPRGSQDRYIVKSGEIGGNWYRVYSDGWVEQGGIYNAGTNQNYQVQDIYLPIRMANNLYHVSIVNSYITNSDDYAPEIYNKNNNGFTFGHTIAATPGVSWKVCGFSDQPATQNKRLYFYVGNFSKTALENTSGWTSEEINKAVGRFNLQMVKTLAKNTTTVLFDNSIASIYIDEITEDSEITLNFADNIIESSNLAYTYELHIPVGTVLPKITWSTSTNIQWILEDVKTPFEINKTSIFLIRHQNGKVIMNYGGAY